MSYSNDNNDYIYIILLLVVFLTLLSQLSTAGR